MYIFLIVPQSLLSLGKWAYDYKFTDVSRRILVPKLQCFSCALHER